MPTTFVVRTLLVATLLLPASHAVWAQAQAAATAPAELPLFAVEITTGPKWDPGKPPQEQQFFREHSSNLKRLRDSGHLVMGARYSDKGLVVLAAQDEAGARALMEEDPSIKAEIFKVQIHPFNVFYGGAVSTRPRRAVQ